MVVEVGFGGNTHVRCANGNERISLEGTTVQGERTGTTTNHGDWILVSTGTYTIGYQQMISAVPPALDCSLSVLCIGGAGEDWDILTARITALSPKYCIPLGKRSGSLGHARAHAVMSTGKSFPKVLRPGQMVVLV